MHHELTTLQRIFALQEQVLLRHIQQFPNRFKFVSSCIDVLSAPNIREETWAAIPVSHRAVFNYLQGDAVSTLISAIRLCLHGCETDAYALMRVVMENLTILSYIVDYSLYDDVYNEIRERAPKGKAFSDRFKYETAIKKLGVEDRREHLRGMMSNVGNHLSPSRLIMSRYKMGDTDHVKAGVSIDNIRIRDALGELASLALFSVMVTDDFLWSATKQTSTDFHILRQELERDYEVLKAQQ